MSNMAEQYADTFWRNRARHNKLTPLNHAMPIELSPTDAAATGHTNYFRGIYESNTEGRLKKSKQFRAARKAGFRVLVENSNTIRFYYDPANPKHVELKDEFQGKKQVPKSELNRRQAVAARLRLAAKRQSADAAGLATSQKSENAIQEPA